jgi:hypothetical protein
MNYLIAQAILAAPFIVWGMSSRRRRIRAAVDLAELDEWLALIRTP